MNNQSTIGIIVSGGPAPGINAVISAIVQGASRSNIGVLGFNQGFLGIIEKGVESAIKLQPDDVKGIHWLGGSILGTSRSNPLQKQEFRDKFLSTLKHLNVDKLIVIGGEGSAYISYHIAVDYPDIQVVHVPKTIDNDLILPNKYPSFGFETARFAGTEILHTLMTDAETCGRWFLVTSMGRKAGFLALGLGVAAGVPLTLIPEEFVGSKPTPEHIARIIFESIRKRKNEGKPWGVAVLAEGILDILDSSENEALKNSPRDSLGRIRYSQIELGDVLLPVVRSLCKKEGIDLKINPKNIGYELRCRAPVSFDIEYCTFLGFGAVRLLQEDKTGVMVTRDFDKLGVITLQEMANPDGTISSRHVDIGSDLYRVALSFMDR